MASTCACERVAERWAPSLSAGINDGVHLREGMAPGDGLHLNGGIAIVSEYRGVEVSEYR
jgi:hypothetical protein